MNKEVLDALGKALKENFDKLQDRPNQYVVAAYCKDNDEFLGYHADSFGTMTKDILQGKRYAGENPYEQLAIIFKSMKWTFEKYPHEGVFSSISNKNREYFKDLKIEDIYIDAVYLAEDTPKQEFRYSIHDINNIKDESED